MDAKKYNNIKLGFSIFESILSFILIFLFVALGLSTKLYNAIMPYSSNQYVIFMLFVLISGIVLSIISFPISYYTGYYLEHKYKLSNQTFFKWIWEESKGLMVGLAIGIPVLLFFFYLIRTFPQIWWLIFATGLFVLSVVLAKIVPIFILPLFYKITPFENDELKERLIAIGNDAGLQVQNIYKFNMSKNTKKANAAFTGLGKSKRILLGDTLIENFTTDEIETVIAHELGHYKKKHIIKNIILGTVLSFLTLFIISLLFSLSIKWFGFNGISYIPALPLLLLWSMVIGLIQTPFTNIISRKYEYEADAYSINITGKKEQFKSALEKLTEQNLADKEPHPFVEWFFYSHPSIKRRILALN